MKPIFLHTGLFLACASLFAVPSWSAAIPRAEGFVGYSYQSLDTSMNRLSANGLQAAGTYNLHQGLGVDADFGAQFRSTQLDEPVKETFSFLFGPSYTSSVHHVNPFVHALFGSMTEHDQPVNRGTDFAMGFGGGLDMHSTPHWALRAIQFDYIPRRLADLNRWDQEIRVGVGLVVK